MNILHFITLDKFSSEPLYLQLSRELTAVIEKGDLHHGDFLPPEKLLCDAFDISPKVVITAYQHLSEKGLVKRFVGKGTQVSTRPKIKIKMSAILRLPAFYPVTFKKVYQDIVLNQPPSGLTSHDLQVYHQIGLIEHHPVFFRKVFLDRSVYQEKLAPDDLITYTRDVLNLDDLGLRSQMKVVNIPALEAAYLDVLAESPGFYLRTKLSHQAKDIAMIHTYFSGEYTVWSDQPETIEL